MNERDYGTAPILKLFFRCTVPAMVGMGFSAIYNVTDGIFVGHFIGQEALAAVNLVMPVLMIITALADMVAAGSSVRISILLGRDEKEEASRVFTVCLKLILSIGILFGLAGFLLAGPLIRLIGADGLTADYARQYLRVFALFLPLCSLYFSTDNYLRVCGKVKMSMTINIVCSILNVALDALLIVVLKKGLVGAAIASSISMSVGTIWSLIPFLRRKLPIALAKSRIALRQMLMIITNGSSEFFISMAGSLMAIILNVILLRLGGSMAVAAVSIVEYIESLTGMVIYSMTDALQPAISYCYGAGLKQRMKKIQKAVMGAAAILSLLAMLFLLLGGQYLLPLFVKDGDTALFDMALRAMRLFALSYLVSWIDTTLSCYLTALEKPWHSLAMSFLGILAYPLLCLAVMVPLWQLDGVWLFPFVSGILSAATTIIIVKSIKIQ